MILRVVMGLVLAISLLAAAGCESASQTGPAAGLRLAALFSDHVVLQRGKPIPVWGWAVPGDEVTLSLQGQTVKGIAGIDGKWLVKLPAMPAGGPYTLTVVDSNETVTVQDVLIGDVWICSGQSNMEWRMGQSQNADAEAAAANYPQIRHFKVDRNAAVTPQAELTGEWKVCTPETVRDFTGVGYFFGRDLNKHLEVPIGLINTSWGGTRVEAWTSRDVLVNLPGMTKDIEYLDSLIANEKAMAEKHNKLKAVYNAAFDKLVAHGSDEVFQKRLADPNFDDSSWKSINTPGTWESQGYKGVDGEGWYRRTVTIPVAWAGKDLALELGSLDEIDTTFFNGVKVGEAGSLKPLDTSNWSKPRHYTVPGRLVKAGKAVIAMRIVDQAGAGGVWAKPEQMYLVPKAMQEDTKARISLAGPWRHQITFVLPRKPARMKKANTASALFNGMVNGLIPYGVKGAIWYQGESNSGNAYAYRVRFPAMIKDWRARWGEDFPFLWVQLANYKKPPVEPENSSWPVVRESQNLTLSLPKTGTGLAIDVGSKTTIHPLNKQDVGHRLSLAARHVAYGEDLVYAGPTYKSMKVEGNTIRLSFDHIGGGLVAKDGPLKQFTIAGADKKFVWADAKIDGDTVVVSVKSVTKPVAVRYAWARNPDGCNLYNKAGQPASPFRTDTWPVKTQPEE